MDRLLGRGGFGRDVFAGGYPPVNVFTGPDDIVVQAELAGVSRDDLDISITGDTLEIKGKKESGADEDKVTYRMRERGSGQFSRTIVLPETVDADRIEARLEAGVLTIRLPKAEAAKPKQITVG